MEKGQIFSLDFLVSLVAATLAVGLLIQAIEVQSYNQKEDELFKDLRHVAEDTANFLVASNDTTCLVTETNEYLINCVDTSKFPDAATARSLLGIPAAYGFSLSCGPLSLSDGTQGDKDFYEAKRVVVTNNGVISKANFDSGTFSSGANPVEARLRVWKE